MKHLKLYEVYQNYKWGDKLKEIEFMNSLKKGDYVLISCEDYELKNELMILTNDPIKTADGFMVEAADRMMRIMPYFDYEIVKKLTPEEAEFLISVNKYNL